MEKYYIHGFVHKVLGMYRLKLSTKLSMEIQILMIVTDCTKDSNNETFKNFGRKTISSSRVCRSVQDISSKIQELRLTYKTTPGQKKSASGFGQISHQTRTWICMEKFLLPSNVTEQLQDRV